MSDISAKFECANLAQKNQSLGADRVFALGSKSILQADRISIKHRYNQNRQNPHRYNDIDKSLAVVEHQLANPNSWKHLLLSRK